MQNQNKSTLGGFTLIELLVVVLIIGILAAVALPQYTKSVRKAQSREAVLALKAIRDGATLYHLSTGSYPTSGTDDLDITIPALKYHNISASGSGNTYTVTIESTIDSYSSTGTDKVGYQLTLSFNGNTSSTSCVGNGCTPLFNCTTDCSGKL